MIARIKNAIHISFLNYNFINANINKKEAISKFLLVDGENFHTKSKFD